MMRHWFALLSVVALLLSPAHAGAATSHSIAGLQAPCRRCMTAALAGFRKMGVIYSITSVRRTYAQQAKLYGNRRHNRYPVARPGTSMHELGLAIDLIFTRRGVQGRAIMKAHGFSQPVKYDPVHWECRHKGSGRQKLATGC